MQYCGICDHLNDEMSLIAKTGYWVVVLAPDQGYLGRCYVTLLQHKGSLADLSQEEWIDFAEIAKKLEHATTKSFGASPSNWACMMNNAFQAAPANPHVHWHFRPRYSKPVSVNGLTFDDPLYGHHYDRDQRRTIDSDSFQTIRGALQDAFETSKA